MNEENKEKKSFRQIVSDALKELKETGKAFIKAPRALWGINVPYVIEGLCYFGLLTILGKYASENIQLTDPQAGWLYGAVTGGITLAMLFFGGVVDKIGVRISLGLSLGMMAVGRGVVSLAGTFPMGGGIGSPFFLITAGGLLVMVLGYGIYQPAAYAGVKRYTNPKTAAISYAVIYSLMNLGAFVFGPISSVSRKYFSDIFPPNGLAAVFWILTALTVLSAILSFVIIKKRVDQVAVERVKKETEEMEAEKAAKKESETKPQVAEPTTPELEKVKIKNTLFILFASFASVALVVDLLIRLGKISFSQLTVDIILCMTAIAAIYEFLRYRPDHPFRNLKFMTFIFVLIPVQTLFAHNWLTLPYYLDRAFRGSAMGDNFEIFSNLNPLLVFIFAPIIAGLTARTNIYKMMVWGTFVMAVPTILLAVDTSATSVIAYITIMTIGESMWQPRFLQWIAEIAPEGKTGAYMGIGQFPWFLTKILTSLYSGYFVAKYIANPDSGGVPNPEPMWFYYALIAMVSPIVLILLSKWLGKGMEKKH
jgi:proton-dependent oligopeptide transporter, POT family